MTRDEATNITIRNVRACFPEEAETVLRDLCAAEVKTWADLGMLKLDEPKSSPEAMLCDVLYGVGLHGIKQRAVLDGITSAGLKLVWK